MHKNIIRKPKNLEIFKTINLRSKNGIKGKWKNRWFRI